MEDQKRKMYCYYLGKPYPLYILIDSSIKKITIEKKEDTFICRCPREGEIDITDALQGYYIKASRKLIEERLRFYQPNFKVKYKSFSIENSQTKWGSCNSNRHLTFHWKLMLFPLKAVDYVVVHELCHLMHMNHDRSFWRLVGKIFPEYKEAMAILGTEKTREM